MHSVRWYAVNTHPHHEKKALEHLRALQVEAFLPLYQRKKRWRNRTTSMLESPLFPGYVFVHIGLESRFTVLNVPSIRSFIASGGLPVPVPDHDIEMLRTNLAGRNPEPFPFVKVGERVRVRSGPLHGLEGLLVQRKKRWRLVLSMDVVMRSVSVEIDAADVEPIP
ncbi:MAG TPA: UpxY family transcription antiterminator [Clostridia bacterium]|nr:UpxY family transcription antiterminator [Clostridia bacterium]